MIQLQSSEDIFLWPDGTRCYREEYEQGHYQIMSDDSEVIPVDTERHRTIAGHA